MNPELMKNWFVVQNGKRIDIHVIHPVERREITVVADVRDEACANLMANAWRYKEALEKITEYFPLTDNETQMHGVAIHALNPLGVSGKSA